VVTGTAAPVTRRSAVKGAVTPYLNPSMVLTELAARGALTAGARSGTATLFLLNGTTVALPVTRVGDDSLVVALSGVELRVKTDAEGRLLGGTVPSQGLTITRGPWLDDTALKLPAPDYSAPAGAPYTAEEVRVPTGRGYELAGTFTRPREATGKLAVAVTVTGSGPQDRDEGIQLFGDYRLFRWVADTLGRRGVAVLRLDDRGTGASGGDFASATSADFAADVQSALAWLRARPDVDAGKLVIVGHSEGGLIAPMVAVAEPALAGIVAIAGPAKTGRTILDYQLRNGIQGDTSLSRAKRDSALAHVPAQLDSLVKGSPWLRFFADHDPIATAKRVKVPALILQGGTDQQVTPEQAEALAAAIRSGGNRQVTLRIFPETNHFMVPDPSGFPGNYAKLPSMAVRPEVLGAIADWIVARTGR
jgi:dipeptidyl aminopeptidase/acylaminoacyl peptidase